MQGTTAPAAYTMLPEPALSGIHGLNKQKYIEFLSINLSVP